MPIAEQNLGTNPNSNYEAIPSFSSALIQGNYYDLRNYKSLLKLARLCTFLILTEIQFNIYYIILK